MLLFIFDSGRISNISVTHSNIKRDKIPILPTQLLCTFLIYTSFTLIFTYAYVLKNKLKFVLQWSKLLGTLTREWVAQRAKGKNLSTQFDPPAASVIQWSELFSEKHSFSDATLTPHDGRWRWFLKQLSVTKTTEKS